ncbi:MAG: hypothetical protein QOF30_2265 [Acidimicrobiaceae bacterium]|jgi:PPOX class probable F420-dependent enzyme|nr:hypothetical protein [Acidimicrobiaceae bacterium]
MTLDEEECWALLATARHGVLGTVHPQRGVDAVPVVFAVLPNATAGAEARPSVVIPLDTVKPKRSARLRRLANIEGDARCVLLVDRYDEDWSQLWWVRLHAVATASSSDASEAVLGALSERYPQYRPPGSVVAVMTLAPTELTGWRAS